MKPKVIAIAGPTASGKTQMAIDLAQKINGEIISADSMQVYRYMDIGSAKITSEEMEKIAVALGAKYFFGFEFEDGTKV